jgi:hypothetical protein
MVHHPWIDLYRARRSMRVLHTAPLEGAPGACAGAGAGAGAAGSGGAAAPLQEPGAGLRPIITTAGPAAPAAAAAKRAAKEQLHMMLHSAASSPCLGNLAAVRGHPAAAAGPAAAPTITALGHLSRLASPAARLVERAAAGAAPVPVRPLHPTPMQE